MVVETQRSLATRDLTSGYNRPVAAITDITVSVQAGQIAVVLGSNGAGKTTLLRTISGLLRPWAGKVLLDGDDVSRRDAPGIVRAGVAHVPEGRRIFPGLTVRENLLMGGYTVRHRQRVEDRLASVLSLFPLLGSRLRQLGATLSGGEQQMLAIGRVLMSQPAFLLMDEPSMGLAPIVVERTFTYIDEIRRQGVGILLVEQNARLALEVADFGYVFEEGHIVLSGPPDALAKNKRVVEAYMTARD